MKYDVLVVGNATMDLIFAGLPRFPVLGEDTLATDFAFIPGEAYTNAVALHRLGIRVAWAADFGNDPFSQSILQSARTENLDESWFVHHETSFQRVSVSASFAHDRAFLSYYDKEPVIPAAFKALAQVDARMILIPGLLYGPLFTSAIPLIRAKKMQIIMDGNYSGIKNLSTRSIRNAIRNTDVFLPNSREARSLTGMDDLTSAAFMLSSLVPQVAIKDGANGAYGATGKTITHVPSIPSTVADTTGAGDCFTAGYIYGLLAGASQEDRLRYGNICGALSTQKHGGTGFHVNAEILHAAYRKYYQPLDK
jgi:sugar/nucleoside kinase (ribokinase family)